MGTLMNDFTCYCTLVNVATGYILDLRVTVPNLFGGLKEYQSEFNFSCFDIDTPLGYLTSFV